MSNSDINDKLRTVVLVIVSVSPRSCLGDRSEIDVATGPYFGGKISVEGVEDDRCTWIGNPKDPRIIHTFIVDHKICGGTKVNSNIFVFLFPSLSIYVIMMLIELSIRFKCNTQWMNFFLYQAYSFLLERIENRCLRSTQLTIRWLEMGGRDVKNCVKENTILNGCWN